MRIPLINGVADGAIVELIEGVPLRLMRSTSSGDGDGRGVHVNATIRTPYRLQRVTMRETLPVDRGHAFYVYVAEGTDTPSPALALARLIECGQVDIADLRWRGTPLV